jgi:hypothetical protein
VRKGGIGTDRDTVGRKEHRRETAASQPVSQYVRRPRQGAVCSHPHTATPPTVVLARPVVVLSCMLTIQGVCFFWSSRHGRHGIWWHGANRNSLMFGGGRIFRVRCGVSRCNVTSASSGLDDDNDDDCALCKPVRISARTKSVAIARVGGV